MSCLMSRSANSSKLTSIIDVTTEESNRYKIPLWHLVMAHQLFLSTHPLSATTRRISVNVLACLYGCQDYSSVDVTEAVVKSLQEQILLGMNLCHWTEYGAAREPISESAIKHRGPLQAVSTAFPGYIPPDYWHQANSSTRRKRPKEVPPPKRGHLIYQQHVLSSVSRCRVAL